VIGRGDARGIFLGDAPTHARDAERAVQSLFHGFERDAEGKADVGGRHGPGRHQIGEYAAGNRADIDREPLQTYRPRRRRESGSEMLAASRMARVTSAGAATGSFQALEGIERLAQAVDRIDALVDMRAVRRLALGVDLDPDQALLAETYHVRRADIAADHRIAQGFRTFRAASACRAAHRLLVAASVMTSRPTSVSRCAASTLACHSDAAMPPFMSDTQRRVETAVGEDSRLDRPAARGTAPTAVSTGAACPT